MRIEAEQESSRFFEKSGAKNFAAPMPRVCNARDPN
jgi:hypothetical protein